MEFQPGDVLAVAEPYWTNRLVRAVTHSKAGHVLMPHHYERGHLICIEAANDGVQFVNWSKLSPSYVSVNSWQEKSKAQVSRLLEFTESLVGSPYDWRGLLLMALPHFGLHDWAKQPKGFVCSTFLAYAYSTVGLQHPKSKCRFVRPSDWDRFNQRKM